MQDLQQSVNSEMSNVQARGPAIQGQGGDVWQREEQHLILIVAEAWRARVERLAAPGKMILDAGLVNRFLWQALLSVM